MKKLIYLSITMLFSIVSFSQVTPQQWAQQYMIEKPDSLNPVLGIQMMDSALAKIVKYYC